MTIRICSFFCALLLILSAAGARGDSPEYPLPAELSAAFDHLLAQVGPEPKEAFDSARIEALLDFVLAADDEPLLYEAPGRRKITSAFHSYEVQSDIDRLLRYAYNPGIPSQVITPSSVRLGRWTEVNSRSQTLPRLWEKLPNLDRPVIVRGTEYVEITPNLATGTYFSYDVNRTLILFPWRGRPVLINISRQRDRSEVGMKGAVLGADNAWNYLYSGNQGLTYGGLGWVKSYMYESYSINMFCETGGERPVLRAGIFKWLDAGWKGINLVRRHHILEGLERYARDLKAVLESSQLPPPEELMQGFTRLSRFPNSELKDHLRRYLARLEARHGGDRALARAGLNGQLRSGVYLDRLSRAELQAALALELMKGFLGRPGADRQLLQAVKP